MSHVIWSNIVGNEIYLALAIGVDVSIILVLFVEDKPEVMKIISNFPVRIMSTIAVQLILIT